MGATSGKPKGSGVESKVWRNALRHLLSQASFHPRGAFIFLSSYLPCPLWNAFPQTLSWGTLSLQQLFAQVSQLWEDLDGSSSWISPSQHAGFLSPLLCSIAQFICSFVRIPPCHTPHPLPPFPQLTCQLPEGRILSILLTVYHQCPKHCLSGT